MPQGQGWGDPYAAFGVAPPVKDQVDNTRSPLASTFADALRFREFEQPDPSDPSNWPDPGLNWGAGVAPASNDLTGVAPGAAPGAPVSPAMRDTTEPPVPAPAPTPAARDTYTGDTRAYAGKNSPYALAQSMLGRGEISHRDALKDYLTTGGENLDPATTAWCAAFVNASLGQGGIKGTGSNLARSFLEWGQAVDTPAEGDVVVLSRGADPTYGHVGFYAGLNPDGTVRVLGGNQGRQGVVSYANFPTRRVLGYRRAF